MSDSSGLGAWRRLVETEGGRGLVARVTEELGADGSPTPARIMSWRRDADAEFVGVAIELVRARRASGGKFRMDAPVLDVSGGEQASVWQIAAYKASRLRDRGVGSVLDLCCGAGADACEFARAGIAVKAVDLNPLRAWMCGTNAGCRAIAGDVEECVATGPGVHVDPARRDEAGGGRRLHALEAMTPGIEVVSRLTAHGGCVKLSPGVEAGALVGRDPSSSVEFVSMHGRLNQALWWRGGLADDAPCRATMVGRDGAVLRTLDGSPAPAQGHAKLGRHVFTMDPTIERASLIGALCAETDLLVVHPSLGLLTGDSLVEDAALTAFEVVAEMAFRRERVREWLRAHDGGIVEVKTRGGACDPDVEQGALRGKGEAAYCVFVLRFDKRVRAIVTRRVG